jgi:hypothetical protein
MPNISLFNHVVVNRSVFHSFLINHKDTKENTIAQKKMLRDSTVQCQLASVA